MTVRVLMGAASVSWHNADETWQSVELANRIVFDRGMMTWEWTMADPIRSWLHPLFFVPALWGLKVTGLSSMTFLITALPRIQQGLLSAFGDLCMSNFFQENFGHRSKNRQTSGAGLFLLMYLANFYLLYCGSRTMVNTFESSLCCIALLHYSRALNKVQNPMKKCTNSLIYVGTIATTFMVRPTAAIFWLPLVFYHMLLLSQSIGFWNMAKHVALHLAPLALASIGAACFIDSTMYHHFNQTSNFTWVVLPWNFFKVNALQGIGTFYGSEPWHYYLSSTLLPALNLAFPGFVTSLHALLFASGNVRMPELPRNVCVYLWAVLWTVTVLSLGVGHKEQRFMLPLLPIVMCFSAWGTDALFSASTVPKGKPWFGDRARKLFGIVYLGLNLGILAFLLLYHNVGRTRVVQDLAKDLDDEPIRTSQSGTKEVFFALPCHFVPAYSHFHSSLSQAPPVDLTFVPCPPPIIRNGTLSSADESEELMKDPAGYLKARFARFDKRLPWRVVMFNTHADIQEVANLLSELNYKLCADYFNAYLVDNASHGKHLLVYRLEIRDLFNEMLS